MNYYKRHLGDYAKDTGHLTALEHGVYTLLLDWYYANERPIPEKLTVRIARGNPEETQTVLIEFFEKTPGGWVHHYADRVIAEYNVKAERNRASGNLGGRPRKTQTVSENNPDVTLAISHKPLVKSKETATVRPKDGQSAEFLSWWAIYPNKQGKQPAWKRWKADKLDAQADALMSHVRLMIETDDGWRRGYVPMGSTYLNQARWQDEPRAAPETGKVNGHAKPPAPETFGAKAALQESETKLERALAYTKQRYERGEFGTGSEALNAYQLECRAQTQKHRSVQ